MNIYGTGEYLKNNSTWHTEDSPWKASNIEAILKANAIRFDTVVEVGCGAGQILAELHTKFPQTSFFGYDISKDVQRFWFNLPSGISVKCDNFLEQKAAYDVLLLIDVFEHVSDYLGFLKKLLPRAQYHVFHVPLELSAQGILRDIPLKTRKEVGHLHYFTKSTALATLIDCGYEIIDYRYTNAAIDRPSSRKARILNLVRKPLFNLAPDLTVRLLGGWSLIVLAKNPE